MIRYWRTIGVDFESKMRDRKGEGWGLRNAKLRLSRKALFAGGLLPVLECYRHPSEAMLDYLDERMSVPSLDRIADAFADHGAVDPGVRTLRAYDEFLAILDATSSAASSRHWARTTLASRRSSPGSLSSARSSRPVSSRCSSMTPSCVAACGSTSSFNAGHGS